MSTFHVHDGAGWAKAGISVHDGTSWVSLVGGDSPAPQTVLRQVSDRTALETAPFTTAGGRVSGTYRVRMKARRAASALTIMHSNLGVTSGGANAFTQALAVEKLDGTIIPVTYGGQHLVTLQPRDHATTDTITVSLAAGEEFWLRTYRQVATSGEAWSGNTIYQASASLGEGTNHYITGTGAQSDQTFADSGAWPSGWNIDNLSVPLPHAVLAQSPDTEPSVALFGDSIMAASSDQYWRAGVNSGGGFGVRSALRDGYAYLSIAQGGRRMSDMLDANRKTDWMPTGLLEACQIGVINMGRNDITGNSATLHADALAVWTYIAGRGVKLAQTTVTPYTDSTDAWATTASQTVKAGVGESIRLTYNAWLRDGAPIISGAPAASGTIDPAALRAGQEGHPLVTVYDVTDAVETARDSGIWKAGYTNDGLHPIAAGHVPMTTVIDYTPLIAAL